MAWGFLIHLDFLYYFKWSHERGGCNLHALFSEVYLTVLSMIFLVRRTERLRMNKLSLENSQFYLFLSQKCDRFKFSWVKEGMVTGNRKSYMLTFLKEEGYFFLPLFLSCFFGGAGDFSSVMLYLKPWFLLLLLWEFLWKISNASLHRKPFHKTQLFSSVCFTWLTFGFLIQT